MLAATAMLNCSGQWKPSDSTKVSNDALRRIYSAALQRDVLLERIMLYRADSAVYSKLLAVKDSINKQLVLTTEADGGINRALRDQQDAQVQQREILEQTVKEYHVLLRKEKRKRFWTGAAGILSTGITTYFLIKK